MGFVEDFAALFAGNRTAYGSEDGGCIRQPVTILTYRQHLHKGPYIGIYPMLPSIARLTPNGAEDAGWSVCWGCVDFDEGDEPSLIHAQNLTALLGRLGVQAWIERSRSKGYHVWVFASEWVPARTMRRALLWATEAVGAPTREVNPKAEELQPGQLGNYVRLPYPGWGEGLHVQPPTHERRVMLWSSSLRPIALYSFLRAALASRVDQTTLEGLAGRYRANERPMQPTKAEWAEPSDDVEELLSDLSPYARKIWREGPLDGAPEGRSGALYKLAARIAEEGRLSPIECKTVLQTAEWNKYIGRFDEDRRLQEIIDKVYG
jgi:hypothetical protein